MNLTDIVDGIAARAAVTTSAETDYTDADGLRRCGVCHELKECRIEFNGILRTVPCLCSCRLKERERKKQEAWEKELADLRASWVKGYEDKTFERGEDTKLMAFAEKYVRDWERVRRDGMSFTLSGGVGCGKTYAAAAIANRLLSEGYKVWMATTSTMLDMMFYDAGKLHNRLANFDLVVIDDFGAERNTEYAAEKIFQIIDERYRSHLPTIVTTNLDINEDAPDLTYSRIYSRLAEFAPQIQSKGADMRRDKGKENKRLLTELWKGE